MYKWELDRHYILEASAGTGKTYAIERIVESLVEQGVDIEKILLVTFTEKATGQLRERMRKTLEKNKQKKVFSQALEKFHKVQISTIHSFCQMILQQYAFENNQSFNAKLINSMAGFDEEIFKMTLRQWFVVEKGDSKILQILGLESDYNLNNFIEGFSKKVKKIHREDLNDIAQILEELEKTFRWLRTKALSLEEFLENFKKGGDLGKSKTSLVRFINKIYQNLDFSLEPWVLAKGISEVNTTSKPFKELGFDCFKQAGCQDLRYHQTIERLSIFHKIYKKLYHSCLLELERRLQKSTQEFKRTRQIFDFNDMIQFVAQALDEKQNSNAKFLVEQLRRRFTYALVDEFQDTDFIQWSIFEKIFVEAEAEQKLFIIGDPKQAIYAFRGADIAAYLKACEVLRKQRASEKPLDTNWRSLPDLVKQYNKIFEDWFSWGELTYTPVKTPDDLTDEQSKRTIKLHEDKTNDCCLAIFDLNKDQNVNLQKFEYTCFIADKITKIVAEKQIVYSKNGRVKTVDYSDICILSRNRSDIALVEKALLKKGINYSFYKKDKIYKSKESLAILHLLKYLAQPNKTDWASLMISPFFDFELEQLGNYEKLDEENQITIFLQGCRSLAKEKKWSQLVDEVLEKTLLYERILPNDEKSWATFCQLWQDFLEIAYKEAKGISALAQHWQSLYTQEVKDEEQLYARYTDENAVQIMTMHASKGLEFPVVFILQPLVKSLNEEAKRLYYVALTRANLKIYLPLPPKPKNKGKNFYINALHSLRDNNVFEMPTLDKQIRENKVLSSKPAKLKLLEEIEEQKFFDRQLRINSFSSLSKKRENIEQTQLKEADEEDGEVSYVVGLPKGAKTGLLMHNILEKINFSDVDSCQTWRELWQVKRHFLQEKIIFWGFNHKQKLEGLKRNFGEEVAYQIFYTLKTPIEVLAKSLSQIKQEDRLEELEFYLDSSQTKVFEKISEVSLSKGYLTGFIDLVFRVGKIYYLLDWKTTTCKEYDFKNLQKSMRENRYDLQYELYSIALCQWLAKKSDKEVKFGGSFYIYLRGMKANGEEGVFFDKYKGSLEFDRRGYQFLMQ